MPAAHDGLELPVPLPDKVDYSRQAEEVPGTRKPGQTGHYRNSYWPELLTVQSKPAFPKTLYEVFNRGTAIAGKKRCLGHRPLDPRTGDYEKNYTWISYDDVDRARTLVGSGLLHLAKEHGFQNDPDGWRVGLWSHNRPEWQIAARAIDAYSLVNVSLYETLGPDVVEYCINHAGIRVVLCNPAHIPSLLALSSAGKVPTLKAVVSMDELSSFPAGAAPRRQSEETQTKWTGSITKAELLRRWGASANDGVVVMDWKELELLGAEHPHPHVPPKPGDMACINYTSGTTGKPKGAMISHEALTCSALASLHLGTTTADDVHFGFLPLAHIYERFIEEMCFILGVPIGFSCGDNLRLVEDVQALRPTTFVAVPRVLNRVYQLVKSQTVDAPGMKGNLLRHVFDTKIKNLRETGSYSHPVYDRLILRRVRAALGGNIKYIGSGSAPISADVLEFLKVAFSCEVIEGYGQTEGCAMATRIMSGDHAAGGFTGPPQVCVEAKLVDVPDMGYTANDKPHPRGELCVRGQTVITGYYKDPEKTKETIDEEGWLHSGDIASVDEVGRIKIIDRIKNLLKLSQGEYVALEKVEGVYSLCPLLAQIFVHGDGLRDHLVAIVVPEPEAFSHFAAQVTGKKVAATDVAALAQLAKDKKVVSAVLKEMDKCASQAKLAGFERAKALAIVLDPFTPENGLLTPTFKLKRNVAAQHFRALIDELYGGAPAKAKL